MTAFEKLTEKYALEASLTELEFRKEELEAVIPELKYQKREADVAAVEYGGLRRFLNRLAGKEEENREQQEMAVRRAAAALESARRDMAAVSQKLDTLRTEWEVLGRKEELFSQLSGEEQAHFQRLEASLAAEMALHYLRKCRKELAAAQELARNPMMAVGDGYRENTHKANAGALADKCREKLEKIRTCGMDFAIHPYIENPMGYIVTAMRFGDQDRMNSAQKGIRETEIALKELLLQLAE